MFRYFLTSFMALVFSLSVALPSFAATTTPLMIAATPGCDLEIGQEYIPEGEEQDIANLVGAFQQGLARETEFRKEKGLSPIAQRRTHPKTQGIVRGKFTVLEDIPAEFKLGIFAEPTTYKSIVRFSNAAPTAGGETRSDAIADTHGVAIKLKGLGEGIKQDFLLNDFPDFIAANPNELINFIMGGAALQAGKQFSELPPVQQKAVARGSALTKASDSLTTNPLDGTYFSQTPYKLGDGAVKYILKPTTAENTPEGFEASDPASALQEAMFATLSEKPVTFDFMVQPQTDACAMPIEDSTIEWTSEPVKVATLKIRRQALNEAKQEKKNGRLAFSPWHALPEHQPLGGLNRARKAVYPPLTKERKKLNRQAKKAAQK